MKRIRVAALIEMNNGYALMHRLDVKKKENSNQPYGEYYVFPGGGVEPDDRSLEEAVKREVMEEFGIEIEVKEQIYFEEVNEKLDEYIFKCIYKSGEFGTGTGPEFSGDPKYVDRGKYIPTIVSKEDIKKIRLIPEKFREKLIKDIIK